MRRVIMAGALLLTGAFGQTPPRTWRFTCDYFNFDVKGRLMGQQRYSALYTRWLPGDMVRWSDATVANASGWAGTFGPAQKQDFMEGFSYRHADFANMTKPDFFRGFPPMAMQARNLVWDTHMFEGFAEGEFEHLKPNIPYHVPDKGPIPLAGAGTFQQRDLQLILTGSTKRDGVECAVVDYRALFNALDSKTAGFALTGRSEYWGQVWVSLAAKQIEYATLYEEVLGELTLAGQPMTISVVRVGVFEPQQK
jgi:hypothetical protein